MLDDPRPPLPGHRPRPRLAGVPPSSAWLYLVAIFAALALTSVVAAWPRR